MAAQVTALHLKPAVSTLTECLACQLKQEGDKIGVSLFLSGGGLLDAAGF